LFPPQGQWRENDYLNLTDRTNRLVELVDGRIEVLPMPTLAHQLILQYFLRLLDDLKAGLAVVSGLRVRMRALNFRQPDITFLLTEHLADAANEFWERADLAVEIVSPDDPDRDYLAKRREYAAAGIAEYWIVDPKKQSVSVLELRDGAYIEHGPFVAGQMAPSILLPQLMIAVTGLFEAGVVKR
ncbi:MAG TPA: Uma2 family endonuclease, partial [Tepidisphaeraceae bacterium]